ncbi:hypothetical protein N9W89_08400 [Hellea sp.]|nr:hypothetical protein [Hellea sp.]
MNIQSLVALTKGQQQPQLSISEDEPTIPVNIETENTVQTSATETQTGEEFSTFLTLLTAQIRNQDPLAPLDSTQFVEQLATFSNLELQAKGNEVLEDIALMLAQSLYATTPQADTQT